MNINGQEYAASFRRDTREATATLTFTDPIHGELLSPWGGSSVTIIFDRSVYTARIGQVTADYNVPVVVYDLYNVNYLGEVHMP